MEKEVRIGGAKYNITLDTNNHVTVLRNGRRMWTGMWSPMRVRLFLPDCPFGVIEERLSLELRGEVMRPFAKRAYL
jgi:hypothetical protein